MAIEQALNNLYAAARAVNANAEMHENLRKCYETVLEYLTRAQSEN